MATSKDGWCTDGLQSGIRGVDECSPRVFTDGRKVEADSTNHFETQCPADKCAHPGWVVGHGRLGCRFSDHVNQSRFVLREIRLGIRSA